MAAEWEMDKELKNASIGFCVQDVKTGKTVASYNSQRALVPASTLKVITTGAALGILGSGYRYETKIAYTGSFNKSTGLITGNLIIIGSGDPSLQSDYFFSRQSITDKWAAVLREKGVTGITGAIVADASCFERSVPDQWIWADIGNYFGATPCGVSYADNKFKIFFNSGKTGTPATLSSLPQPYLKNRIDLLCNVRSQGSSDEAYVYGDPFGWKKFVSGTIPPGRTDYEIEAALPDPALLCAEALYSSLIRAGIRCQSEIHSAYHKQDSAKHEILYTHYSPTLDQLVYYTNLKSNNHYCESFLQSVGRGSRSAGILAVKNYWKSKGLDVTELFMTDGSGLARASTVTPAFLTQVLSLIAKDSLAYRIISNSFPVAGRQGSMSSIGKGSPIEGKLRAKTGYISRVRAYCGYHISSDGKELAFSLLFNNYNCTPAQARMRMEKFLIALHTL